MDAASALRDIERRTPVEIAFSLHREIEGATLLVGPGQFSPYPEHERVMVLSVDESNARKPRILWDRFLAKSAIAPFCDALGLYAREVQRAEFDTMYATAWAYAWTRGPGPFGLYGRSGWLVLVKPDGVLVRCGDRNRLVPLAEMTAVEGWLSGDWVKREVRLLFRKGEPLVVAETEEPFALADPTYDGIDLMCDASWVAALGKAMAEGLGLPYKSEDSALQ